MVHVTVSFAVSVWLRTVFSARLMELADVMVGGRWVHLRMCMTCGHVGCCDSSPAKHATAHFHSVGHPLVQSYEPGEDWWWCYVDNVAFEVPNAPSYSHS